jgi:hypothetical protein
MRGRCNHATSLHSKKGIREIVRADEENDKCIAVRGRKKTSRNTKRIRELEHQSRRSPKRRSGQKVRSGAMREFSVLASAPIGSFSEAVATEPRSAIFGHGLAKACSLKIFASAPRGKPRVAISGGLFFDY